MAISSTTPRPLPTTPAALKANSQNELVTVTRMSDKAAKRAKFEEAFAKIRDELVDHIQGEGFPAEAVEWYKNNLEYNVPGGKLNRGISVVDSVEIFKGRALTEQEYFRAALLGWCIELLQAFFLVSDDMMDSSITRRGQPCWYRLPKVGMLAINDSFMLEGAIYHLIKRHFRQEPYYADLLDLFHETTYQTEYGQLVDLITAPEDQVDLSKFSLDRHRLIVIYKTAFYSFYLPVACAMLISGIPYPTENPPKFSLKGTALVPTDGSAPSTTTALPANADPYTVALSILIPLGEYFQVQDDWLDYSATPEVLGKIGTDIVDNKCSWVINTALLLTSSTSSGNPFNPKLTPARLAELRKVLEENYGKKDAQAVHENRVKAVYEELNIRGAYEKYEETVVGILKGRIGSVEEKEGGLKKVVFESFLGKIYKRSK
ncbi:hypothetical protein EST38_g9662 [Candolleomyces aberdarensis]|uniref:(2E,6E)-farnesyl diphosphate synthase n=1 Tax=Candolleomyces aberdarensis TaxID=2316362 RepID=A0A4Q2D9C9_9AGAR|nr:hypothetical protein EST38_g9662 [Candolleomyces aberdarensis]